VPQPPCYARSVSGVPTVAPDPRASEEMRHLTQSRLALLGLVTFALGGGFLVVSIGAEAVLYTPDRAVRHLLSENGLLNAVGAVVSLVVWLIARTGQRSAGQLLLIDAIGTLAAIVPYTLMSVIGQTGIAGVLLTGLTAMLILQTRALMVPSDARRTAIISGIAAAVSLALTWVAHARMPDRRGDADMPDLILNLVMWLSVVVASATVASWVLFGLRQQIHEAKRLGQYILREKIGQGGMGLVYKADHALLRRPTAVKLLPPDLAGEEAVKRFEREVQLTAGLRHPNTVTVFDYGRTSDGVFYYVMEFLGGGDLETIVRKTGPMPPARVRHVLEQMAAGLSEAHEIGLIHRDIKPANVLLEGDGPVADLAKIVDFGLVRETETEGVTSLTQTNSVMGTPLYMAPETISAPSAVDARSDLYAVGAVGYFLLTGAPVFDGRTVVEICSHHLHTRPDPPSSRVDAPLPETLEEIVMRCLEKDPDARPQSAPELLELLGACEDVPLWTPADARAWWAEHRAAITAERIGGVGTASTVAVDLGGR